jgi:hypothetical protein
MPEAEKQTMTDRRGEEIPIALDTTLKLLDYCRKNNWAGYDPYDALNSRLYRALPFLHFNAARLLLTQGIKRSPVNLRPFFFVPKSLNPKGVALFLSSHAILYRVSIVEQIETVGMMARTLLALRSGYEGYTCWGYNFPWQTRSSLIPKGMPNIICSSFAANSLLDAYEITKDPSYLAAAISATEFILDRLFWKDKPHKACFSYTPDDRSEIHNANLLGAALLCRVSHVSGKKEFLEPAIDATRYSVSKQHEDGSWDYGESPNQRWIDNFHTGFNLVALKNIQTHSGSREFTDALRQGFSFYRTHFFREDAAPRYFHNATYPIDVHSIAQSIITLIELRHFSLDNLPLAHSVLKWALTNMWNPRGFFFFQKHRFHTVRISFMRWSQAWMLLALSRILETSRPFPEVHNNNREH